VIWQHISLNLTEIRAFFAQVDWHHASTILSPGLVAAVVSNLVALILKVLILSVKTRRVRRSELGEIARSGGMPSSHSATVTGLAVAIGVSDGFGSSVFALAVIFAIVVMVDATQVRRAVGEQGETLRVLMDNRSDEGAPPGGDHQYRPYHARGHKPSEVAAGVLVGLICGLAIAIAMG